MRDSYQRRIDYLRISVTDRCNLRCRYCMPEAGVALKKHEDILSLEEISRIIKCAAEAGISKVRLTGGEPLVRKGFVGLVEEIRGIATIEDIAITTNGILLGRYARELKEAGLNRVNISLDTMNQQKFSYISRGGNLDQVWQGVEAALALKLEPVKLNMVVVKDFNDDELLDFAHLTMDRPLHVRFIELMPIGESRGEGYLSLAEVQQRINDHFGLKTKDDVKGNGPARNYIIPGAKGTVGFIAAISRHFCSSCNRLRLTADGRLRPCLQKNLEIDLKTALHQGAGDEALRNIIFQAVHLKPKEHDMASNGWGDQPRNMSQIGG